MRRWLIVPAKPFREAKSRLAAVMTEAERTMLSAALLERTLCIAGESRLFEQIVVVSRDPAALAAAQEYRAIALPEESADLNVALAQAADHAFAAGASAALLLPTDLPQLCATDLHSLVAAFADATTIVIAPSRDGGTNALFLPLPAPFAFAFGADSCRLHQQLAHAAGCSVTLVYSDALSFDLDSPADLAELTSAGASVDAMLATCCTE